MYVIDTICNYYIPDTMHMLLNYQQISIQYIQNVKKLITGRKNSE